MDFDRSLDGAGDRAEICVQAVNALDGLALLFRGAQFVVGEDTANDQNFALELNLSPHLARELSVRRINLARFQRAPEGSGQSASRRGDHVIERGGARRKSFGRNFVVSCDLGVHAEDDRVFFRRQVG